MWSNIQPADWDFLIDFSIDISICLMWRYPAQAGCNDLDIAVLLHKWKKIQHAGFTSDFCAFPI